MRVEWSIFAIEDREAIFDYIEQDNPGAAAAVDDRIEQQVDTLERFPEMGRLGRAENTRELISQRTPYIAVYSIWAKKCASCASCMGRGNGPASSFEIRENELSVTRWRCVHYRSKSIY